VVGTLGEGGDGYFVFYGGTVAASCYGEGGGGEWHFLLRMRRYSLVG